MAFLDDNYLLGSGEARTLFSAVRSLPVVDPHNHADVREIADNANYTDPWRLFAATDHYVWEVLRKRGVPEDMITGGAAPREKWGRMAAVFPEIAGNPVYEWVHLDLRRGLGVETVLGPDTAAEVWDKACEALARPDKRPLELLRQMNVEVMCSTDDPADSLEHHARANAAAGRTLVRPTWRPDKAMNIQSPAWPAYIHGLAKVCGGSLDTLDDLLAALSRRHDFFHESGCRASDHGLTEPLSGEASPQEAARVYAQTLASGKPPCPCDAALFRNHLFGELAEMNARRGWVTQLHIGAVRDVRSLLFKALGPDSGGDVSSHAIDILPALSAFLNRFDGRLKVVLYCLDPGHQATLATLARAFGADVRLGSAWWLCDTPVGMRRQLEYVGSVDLLANFAGMVSDSRKLLSYGSRHEMFRRVLCDVLGQMVAWGQMPAKAAESLAVRMCYTGVKEFWGV